MSWARGASSVRWAMGALVVRHRDQVLLLDAPAGGAAAVAPDVPGLRLVAITSGRIESVGGLISVLHAAALRGPVDRPLTVLHGGSDERTPALVDAWTRGWTVPRPVQVDAVVPGESVVEPPFLIESCRLRRGELGGRAVEPAEGMALRITTEDLKLAFVPAAAPQPGLARFCDGADLAVVEVGRTAWPPTRERWRLGMEDAVAIAARAEVLWIVGDDGSLLTGGASPAGDH